MLLTVIQASRATGKSRQTLYRLVDSGKLSANTDNEGRLVFDTSELMRHFGQLQAHDKPDKVEQSVTSGQASQLQVENAQLRAQLEANQEQLRVLTAAIEKAEQREVSMNERMDKLMNVVEALTLRLEHGGRHSPVASQETPEQPKVQEPMPNQTGIVKSILGRLFR